MNNVLITGSMGIVGSQLISHYLKKTDFNIFAGFHQGALKNKIDDWVAGMKVTERMTVVPLEITSPMLGLESSSLSRIRSQTTHIIHAAATTRFDLPIEKARAINVLGTEHVLQLAEVCSNLQQIGLASTVFVAGKRTGMIKEEELTHQEGFVNTYEQSKYEMEQLAHTYYGKLPVAIYRFSTILGNSKTGYVRHFTAPHHALRLMYLGLASMIPGKPDYSVDLIPSDVAGEIFFRLFQEHFSEQKTYHIVAGEQKSYQLQQLIDQTYLLLGQMNPTWAAKNYPKPSITNSQAFDLFLESARQAGNPMIVAVLTALSHFAHQLGLPKTFSCENTRIKLPEYDKLMPEINQYYDKVVAYCLKTNWGKNL